jgi:hypothetical protein
VREARNGDNRGGLVPDLTIRNFPTVDGTLPRARVYEVKTFVHNGRYGQAGALKPVERRGAGIPGDYVKLARATNEKHCAMQAGADGPVLHRLRALTPRHGIVSAAATAKSRLSGSLLRWSETA